MQFQAYYALGALLGQPCLPSDEIVLDSDYFYHVVISVNAQGSTSVFQTDNVVVRGSGAANVVVIVLGSAQGNKIKIFPGEGPSSLNANFYFVRNESSESDAKPEVSFSSSVTGKFYYLKDQEFVFSEGCDTSKVELD